MEVDKPLPDGRGRGRRSQAQVARNEALALRMAGLTYEQIGERLGRSKAWAHKTVTAALDGLIQENAAELRRLELARLDRAQQRVYTSALGGNLPAVDRLLKIMERRAKYLDLDNPNMSAAVVTATNLLGALSAQIESMPDTYEPVDDD